MAKRELRLAAGARKELRAFVGGGSARAATAARFQDTEGMIVTLWTVVTCDCDFGNDE